MSPRTLLWAVVAAACALPSWAHASTEDELFAAGAAALSEGRFTDAIDAFEGLADRGFAHPDASFDRGLAYAMRVREGAGRDGDLGRAVAGFEEALVLRPGDADAERALDAVRAEITRRRSKRGKSELNASPSLDRQLVGLLSVRTWGLLCLVASGLLSVGLVLRKARDGALHVAGSVLVPVTLAALAALLPSLGWADHLARATRPAVSLAAELPLEDESGRPLVADSAGDPTVLPEGARVEVRERRGPRALVRWGSNEGWVTASELRLLATP